MRQTLQDNRIALDFLQVIIDAVKDPNKLKEAIKSQIEAESLSENKRQEAKEAEHTINSAQFLLEKIQQDRDQLDRDISAYNKASSDLADEKNQLSMATANFEENMAVFNKSKDLFDHAVREVQLREENALEKEGEFSVIEKTLKAREEYVSLTEAKLRSVLG